MLKAGCWGKHKMQLHRFYGWDEVRISFDPKQGYQIEAPEAFASETKLSGHIAVSQEKAKNPGFMSDAGEISFSLKLKKEITFNVGYGAGSFFRFLKAFDMYWHAEGIKTLVEGKITLDGRTYEVRPETSFGYSDKNWGSDFTTPWVWLSSNDIYSHREKRKLENSAFDIGGGRPVVFHVPLNRKLLGVFDLEGNEKTEFNFSKFWMGVKTVFSKEEDEYDVIWHVRQSNHHYQMETEVHCHKADMLFVQYEDPLERKRFKHLYNGGTGTGIIHLYAKKGKKLTLLDTYDVGHVGCEYGEYED